MIFPSSSDQLLESANLRKFHIVSEAAKTFGKSQKAIPSDNCAEIASPNLGFTGAPITLFALHPK